MDKVFRALADPSRRQLLDSLNSRNGQTLGVVTAPPVAGFVAAEWRPVEPLVHAQRPPSPRAYAE